MIALFPKGLSRIWTTQGKSDSDDLRRKPVQNRFRGGARALKHALKRLFKMSKNAQAAGGGGGATESRTIIVNPTVCIDAETDADGFIDIQSGSRSSRPPIPPEFIEALSRNKKDAATVNAEPVEPVGDLVRTSTPPANDHVIPTVTQGSNYHVKEINPSASTSSSCQVAGTLEAPKVEKVDDNSSPSGSAVKSVVLYDKRSRAGDVFTRDSLVSLYKALANGPLGEELNAAQASDVFACNFLASLSKTIGNAPSDEEMKMTPAQMTLLSYAIHHMFSAVVARQNIRLRDIMLNRNNFTVPHFNHMLAVDVKFPKSPLRLCPGSFGDQDSEPHDRLDTEVATTSSSGVNPLLPITSDPQFMLCDVAC